MIEHIELNLSEQRLIVIYPLEKMRRDDFLKIFKETMSPFGVFIYSYQEKLLTKDTL